jgi:hypothetical protein
MSTNANITVLYLRQFATEKFINSRFKQFYRGISMQKGATARVPRAMFPRGETVDLAGEKKGGAGKWIGIGGLCFVLGTGGVLTYKALTKDRVVPVNYPTKGVEAPAQKPANAVAAEGFRLDHSSHVAYMDSFLKALQAGKRDVYLSGSPYLRNKEVADLLRDYEGVGVDRVEQLVGGDVGQRGFEVFFSDGRSLVFKTYGDPGLQKRVGSILDVY